MSPSSPAAEGLTEEIRIDHESAIHVAASAARGCAQRCGLPGAMPDQAAVVASELASNQVKHAADGTVYVQPTLRGDGVEITAVDRGPGIRDLDRSMADGYTTTGSLGAGLGAVRRIATEFTIRTQPGSGTLVNARLSAPGGRPQDRYGVGSVCLPAHGEKRCGDACTVAGTGDALTGLVVDGLGHGAAAAEAARSALRSFHTAPDRPLADILTSLHRSLRHTRGAAAGVVRVHPDRAEYCGTGNIRAAVLSGGEVLQRMAGQPGIVGWNVPTPRPRTVPLARGAAVVLHSDGIESRWSHSPPTFLLRLPPSLLTAALAHGHRRVRDDATVLTVQAA
ncbi:SpoIIE family protein phosphatase [Streptomyces sp. CNQ085]|uniref:SpoIIE family protein phosphatase n=1 Tax=Streptomyces sp. CNQ085 TaxID=2886944 RepID=UPI001F513983|nr:SpoIIE family protein phosphatase [Streptomyces sp. CNQ085]MCI0385036.1 SpoIIE family protein phosphatase [Streptomyces sp. CNQ085]